MILGIKISDQRSNTNLQFGAHFHLCLGPHAMSDIYRGGPLVYAQEHAELMTEKARAPAGPTEDGAATGATQQPQKRKAARNAAEEKY